MTIAVTDTQTGQALTVRDVTAALDRIETPMAWADEIDAWHIKKRGRTFSAALSEMRAAIQLAGDRLDELGIKQPQPAASCTCPWVDPSLWTTHYGATEPGSQREWDPDCPEHGQASLPPDPVLAPEVPDPASPRMSRMSLFSDAEHAQAIAAQVMRGSALPPDPALQLAPDRLDAEHAQAMAIQAERRRRMTALVPVGQRTAIVPPPFVPQVPWTRRAKTWASGWGEWLKPSGGERR